MQNQKFENNPQSILSQLASQKGIDCLEKLFQYLRILKYQRNSNRHDLSLVIKEERGTCSSKHAFAKAIAIEQGIKDIELILCLYKMNPTNTPGIENHIFEAGLEFIPEAHCYIKQGEENIDLTNLNSSLARIENDILKEESILPEQVNTYKVDFHKTYIRRWIEEENIKMNFDQVWAIREKCIESLSNITQEN